MTRRRRTRSPTPPICRSSNSTSKDRSRSWSWGAAARPIRTTCGARSPAPICRTGCWSPPSQGKPIHRRPPARGRRWTAGRPHTSAATSPARRPSPGRTSSPVCCGRAPELLAPEHGETPLALRGQTLARVRAALHAVEELLQVVPPTGTPLLDQAPHERLHGADRERRIVRDLVRELRDGVVEARGGDDAIHEPERERRLGAEGLAGEEQLLGRCGPDRFDELPG